MKFLNPYWKVSTKIQLLQRWVLVHSYLYYSIDNSIIPDYMFDNNSRQLYKMQNKFKKSFKKSKYYYAMKEFDGSSGFGLFEKLTHKDQEIVMRDANTAARLNESRVVK